VRAEGVELRNLQYPEPDELQPDFAQAPLAVYERQVEVTGEVAAGPSGEGRLLVTFQPCDASRCLPEATLSVPIP